jgi:hypothetical protein
MLHDPGVWLFGLAVALFLAGVLGVVLSTRRVPPEEAVGLPGLITDPGVERQLVQLEAEVERLRAERAPERPRPPPLRERRHPAAARRAHLVTRRRRERRAGAATR